MTAENHIITINNFINNANVCYSVILLKGEISTNINAKCPNNGTITFLTQNNNFTFESLCPLQNEKFKQLITLRLGSNSIKIKYCCTHIVININFKPSVTEYCVIPVYILCKNHDGKFQSPETEDNSVDSACERISVGTKLIQCLFAEKFYENGLSRKTFQIEMDLNPQAPKCRIFHSNLNVEEIRSMGQEELWSTFGRELMKSTFASDKFKYLAFISCTRYRGDKYNGNITMHDDIVGLTEAHAALGGGGLAIFGSACLHTWPRKLEDVTKCFQNETPVDKTQFMDDSCYR